MHNSRYLAWPAYLVAIAMVFVVNPNLAAQNLKDFIQLAKQRPGDLNYGSSGSGSTSHLVSAALAQRAGITLTHVPYKGAVQSLTDLITAGAGQSPSALSRTSGCIHMWLAISDRKVRVPSTRMS